MYKLCIYLMHDNDKEQLFNYDCLNILMFPLTKIGDMPDCIAIPVYF